ncbi:DUF3310 domain-containing protein [Bifidobacterium samirii]|uniref:DUF3310 domain-containing protein n=1 Tax=Bifidobacterium samirii TaxID=2306974 RepID=A0A430FJK5_9BIFI|nr:DUF3310 domain-containing protein [Bifidobacterium samirii]RSX53007.1 DUF3310 domain-containing protein [Bifidobacterium samirii]
MSTVPTSPTTPDMVEHPAHYTRSHPGMECIQLTGDCTFCMGNCCKYLWRYRSKGHPVEDLRKAQWYLRESIARNEPVRWTLTQTRILIRLRGEAERDGNEPEYRVWRDLAIGDVHEALLALADLIEHMYEYDTEKETQR